MLKTISPARSQEALSPDQTAPVSMHQNGTSEDQTDVETGKAAGSLSAAVSSVNDLQLSREQAIFLSVVVSLGCLTVQT